MKKYLLTPLIFLLFVACGGTGAGNSTPSSSQVADSNVDNVENMGTTTIENPTSSSFKMAVNNTGKTVNENFADYVLKVMTSKVLSEANEISQSTIAIYGTINSNATKSLLKINTNYINSTIYIAVFKDEVLVAQSKTFTISNKNAINFGEITIN